MNASVVQWGLFDFSSFIMIKGNACGLMKELLFPNGHFLEF